ncbi:stage III sporulation protein AA [Anaerotignum faecicola]|nr:stage III sporulation protein AA [Anaerotignum faecicola]
MSIKDEIILALGGNIREVIKKMTEKEFDSCEELRIRAERPVSIKIKGRYMYLDHNGTPTEDCRKGFCASMKDIGLTMEILSGYSLYAYSEEIKRGFITINGGHRVGLCGNVIVNNNEITDIRRITSLNFRIAHQVKGCAEKIMPYIINKNTAIISPPGCGKTTLLRDIIRLLSNGGATVSVVDERSEISGGYGASVKNDCGINTDILNGCPKQKGMEMLLRSMGPQYIAVDEIGGVEDGRIIAETVTCGVKVICTAHGSTASDIFNRRALKELKENKTFDVYIFLQGVGNIKCITDSNFNEIGKV